MNTCEPFTLRPCPTEQLAHVTFYDPYGRTVLVCTTTLSNDPSWTGPTAHEQNETNESNETRRERTDGHRQVGGRLDGSAVVVFDACCFHGVDGPLCQDVDGERERVYACAVCACLFVGND